MVHRHPCFSCSYDPKNSRHKKETEKVERYLKAGHKIGDYKSDDLFPLTGYPREEGGGGLRLFYVLCRDCGKSLFTTLCPQCGTPEHSMDDAVLFEIDENHNEAYKKAKKNLRNLKNETWSLPAKNS